MKSTTATISTAFSHDDETSVESFIEDWRIKLLGHHIQRNPKPKELDEEEIDLDEEMGARSTVSTIEALSPKKYDYIALFIGADYCPHCKAFAPTVTASHEILEGKRCKVIFVSNDRTEEAFQASVKKNQGIDVMLHDTEKTKAMRDMFGLKTIPAFMILRNEDFSSEKPKVVTNGRDALAADPKALHFPWIKLEGSSSEAPGDSWSLYDRIVINGKYGKWWELGHHANPAKPSEMYMDEHAVRIRAGILNSVTWIALMNIWFWRIPTFIMALYPIAAFEFLVSANIGLGPIAPVGVIATVMASVLQPKPFWKPAKPKRFAWYIGLTLATSCLIIFLNRDSMGKYYRPSITVVALLCNIATWLESSAGFCIGCFIYNTWLVPMFKLEACSECKL